MSEAILPGNASGRSNIWEHIGTYTNNTTSLAVTGVTREVIKRYLILTFSIAISNPIPGNGITLDLYIYGKYIAEFEDSGFDTIQPRNLGMWTLIQLPNNDISTISTLEFAQGWLFTSVYGANLHIINDDYIVSIRNAPTEIASRVANALYVDVYGINYPF